MPKKKTETEEVIEKIYDYTLEDIMGERFGSYSKYIIQDRAIPDARDGLKPVQRRILYSMYREHNTFDRPYRKSAKTVGDVIGNYHPHGDSSIYDAMVRMSQDWKIRLPYIDMHGNNGSIDGDSPAAYRYTEARLSKISNEMIRDIDKNTVEFSPNFDDSTVEPTVLPTRFPALLVNGATGISAGYATNIPPHNLSEVIDATIYLIDHPNSELDQLMQFVKGPDFPTGAIIEGLDGIKEAYTKGKGKVVVTSKTLFEEKGGKLSLIITEIPYEVNKALLVKKIDEIRLDKKVEGILEVRDESEKDIRIAIDLKKDANRELILNYLLKNTDLQSSYSFNMVTIVNRRPKLLGLKGMLDAFVSHQREVVKRRTEFDLDQARKRVHIVDGLIKCLSILDEVIKVIRASKNKSDAKDNLVKEFEFTYEQAEAIVVLQLYRLTNTDVVALEEEKGKLDKLIKGLSAILEDEKALKYVMKKELKQVRDEFDTPRLTTIKEEVREIKIDQTDMIPKEDVIVMITKDGYIKRTSLRSYSATNDSPTLKENDYIIGQYEMNTLDTLLVFTSLGNYLHIPVHAIYDMKWKEMGKHISNIVPTGQNEEIIGAIPAYDFSSERPIILITKNGMIKRSVLKEFSVSRWSKPINCMKLKDDDKLIQVCLEEKDAVFVTTKGGFGLSFSTSEIPIAGVKAGGVKAINLKNDEVVSLSNFSYQDDDYLIVITDKNTAKRIKLSEFELSTRTRKGLLIVREVKSNPHNILKTFITDSKNHLGLKSSTIIDVKITELPISDRYSIGKEITKHNVVDAFIFSSLITKDNNIEDDSNKEEEKPKRKQVDLDDIDNRLLTIDDFLK
ncbi:MAG: DNA topoisomerase IV subunit A [Bacilli bacterium]|nr:DNA topoisomerase IV subunit A [Bacilli bacterium]